MDRSYSNQGPKRWIQLENHHGCGGEEKAKIQLFSAQKGTLLPQDGGTAILNGQCQRFFNTETFSTWNDKRFIWNNMFESLLLNVRALLL